MAPRKADKAEKNALQFLTEERANEQRRNELNSEGQQVETQMLQVDRQLRDLATAKLRLTERRDEIVAELEELPEAEESPVGGPGPPPVGA